MLRPRIALVVCTHLFNLIIRQAGSSGECCALVSPPEGSASLPGWAQSCGFQRPAGLPFASRSAVLGRAAAAASHPLVTRAMLAAMERGGSAVDAAIAGNALQGVVEPMSNGLGGDAMALIYDPKTKRVRGYNGSGRSPRGQSRAALLARLDTDFNGTRVMPTYGALSVRPMNLQMK